MIEELNITTRISSEVYKRILRYLGHISCKEESLERLVMVEGKWTRVPGWMDGIKRLTSINPPNAFQAGLYEEVRTKLRSVKFMSPQL